MTQLLDPATLAKLRPLGLRAQRIARGVWAGIHPSPSKGASIEFAEHKQYSQGDELRHLDWKIFGKSDKLFVKQFEAETNIAALFVLDTSGSMGYCGSEMSPDVNPGDVDTGDNRRGHELGVGSVSKLAYAAMMSAGLAHVLQGQQDAVGLACGADQLDLFVPPRPGPKQLAQLFHELEAIEPRGESHLREILRPVLEAHRRRTLILLFTDGFDLTEEDWSALRQLRSRGHELAFFHMLDPYELSFPFQSWSDFQGLEGESPVQVDPMAQRESYLRRIDAFIEDVRERCIGSEINYLRVVTSEPLDRPLLAFLMSRRRGGGR